jgi:hypothetical protein
MAITYVGGKVVPIAASASTTTTVSLTDLGGSLAENDVIIVAYAVSSGFDAPVEMGVSTSGYSAIDLVSADTIATTMQMSVSAKRMGASPDASVNISPTTSISYPGVVLIQAWRGVDTSTAFDVASTTAALDGTFLANPPSITPVTAGAVVAAFGASGSATSAGRYTSPDLSNFQSGAGGPAGGVEAHIGGGSIAYTGSAVDPAQFGLAQTDSTDYAAVALTLALRPAEDVAITGSASGTLPLTGSSVQGSVATGTASGEIPLTGTASAGTSGGPIQGTASGTLPLTGSSLAEPPAPPTPSIPSPASPARVGRIIREFRVVTAGPDTGVVTRYGNLARDTAEPLETFFDSEADAQAMADERLALLSVTRSLVTVQIQGIDTAADLDPSLTLPTVTIIDDEQGRNSAALVFGVSIDMKTERSTLETWG